MGELLERAYGPVVARVTSSRDSNVTYEVRLKGGTYACSCKSFLFRGRCKHADAIQAQGLTAPLEEIH
jgi:SWIM zinc finger